MGNKINKSAAIILTMTAMISGCNMPLVTNPTEVAIEPSAAPPPTEVAIQHEVIPIDLPAERSSHAGDHDSSKSASNKQAPGGDRFTFGEYERPFNANTMDVYFPALDIFDTLTHQDDLWIFGSITVKGLDENNTLSGEYAMELDLDINGKGDWLILVKKPGSTEWTTDGVQVWQDTNKDVGGSSPAYADENSSSSDGFDHLLFEAGQGDDPDSAWARISSTDPNTIELAVKRSLLDDPDRYMIGMWAGTDLDPSIFDLNDHMTHEQAGAAIRGYEIFYPIKELAELDGACRMAVGFAPKGDEPGLCKTLVPVLPGQPLDPAAPICSNSCQYGQEPYPACTCWPG